MRAGATDLSRQVSDLSAKLRAVTRRLTSVSQTATSANTASQQSAKRFRIGCFVTPLTILGGQVTGNVTWSSPMPSAGYNVDACMSIANMPAYTVTNQTAAGCTVTFNAPILLAAGTIVIVLAVSPAS